VRTSGVQAAMARNDADAVRKPGAIRDDLLQEIPRLLHDWRRSVEIAKKKSFFYIKFSLHCS